MTKNNEGIKSVKCEASVHTWVAMWSVVGIRIAGLKLTEVDLNMISEGRTKKFEQDSSELESIKLCPK